MLADKNQTKRHRFRRIVWLGDGPQKPTRYGVVEMTQPLGPILRTGPMGYSEACRERRSLERGLAKPPRRETWNS